MTGSAPWPGSLPGPAANSWLMAAMPCCISSCSRLIASRSAATSAALSSAAALNCSNSSWFETVLQDERRGADDLGERRETPPALSNTTTLS